MNLPFTGIHGHPLENWNGEDKRLPVEYDVVDWGKNAFCRHGSVVFPTWHRAYIYQFEVIAKTPLNTMPLCYI